MNKSDDVLINKLMKQTNKTINLPSESSVK